MSETQAQKSKKSSASKSRAETRGRKLFHVNIPGHHSISATEFTTYSKNGVELECGFYCLEYGENNQTPHTHFGIHLAEERTKQWMIQFMKYRFDLAADNLVHVETNHRSITTIAGYHYGFGEKECCDPKPIWFYPENFDEASIMNKLMRNNKHTKRGKQLMNALFLSSTIEDLVYQGEISFFSIPTIAKGMEIMKASKRMSQRINQSEIKWPWEQKKRHLYIYGPSNLGKSAFMHAMANQFGVDWLIWNAQEKFQDYAGQRFIFFDEFNWDTYPNIPLEDIFKLADGLLPIPAKGGNPIQPPKDVVVVIVGQHCPEQSIKQLNPMTQDKAKRDAFYNRFWVLTQMETCSSLFKSQASDYHSFCFRALQVSNYDELCKLAYPDYDPNAIKAPLQIDFEQMEPIMVMEQAEPSIEVNDPYGPEAMLANAEAHMEELKELEEEGEAAEWTSQDWRNYYNIESSIYPSDESLRKADPNDEEDEIILVPQTPNTPTSNPQPEIEFDYRFAEGYVNYEPLRETMSDIVQVRVVRPLVQVASDLCWVPRLLDYQTPSK